MVQERFMTFPHLLPASVSVLAEAFAHSFPRVLGGLRAVTQPDDPLVVFLAVVAVHGYDPFL
jgi:hypothetical protein